MMNAGCAGKTVRSLENVPYLSTLEVCSRQGAIHHRLPYLSVSRAIVQFPTWHCTGLPWSCNHETPNVIPPDLCIYGHLTAPT